MIRAAWLIAEREFRTYTATWTFWLALLIGPLLMAGAVLVASAPDAPVAFRVSSTDAKVAAAARRAVVEALAVGGADVATSTDRGPRLTIREAGGVTTLTFDPAFPLSPSGKRLVVRTLELEAVRPAGAATPKLTLAPDPPPDLTQPSRFAVMLMLFLSLTGSLGMLLQAVVRERSNRALETLLASASPTAIVVGKVAGVGLVSVLVLATWLGSAAASAALTPNSAQVAVLPELIRSIGDPILLGRAAVIYLLAYAFYGLTTVAIGAMARDTAAAQNLSRPMFLVLMAAFFISLASAGGAKSQISWLLFAPPFTPFVLLMQPATFAAELFACALLLVSAGVAGWLATALLKGVLAGRGKGPRIGE